MVEVGGQIQLWKGKNYLGGFNITKFSIIIK